MGGMERRLKRTAAAGACILLAGMLQAAGASAETYEYDQLNRVSRVIYDDGSCQTYTYDANGNLKEITSYDSSGKIIKTEDTGNSGQGQSPEESSGGEGSGGNAGGSGNTGSGTGTGGNTGQGGGTGGQAAGQEEQNPEKGSQEKEKKVTFPLRFLPDGKLIGMLEQIRQQIQLYRNIFTWWFFL